MRRSWLVLLALVATAACSSGSQTSQRPPASEPAATASAASTATRSATAAPAARSRSDAAARVRRLLTPRVPSRPFADRSEILRAEDGSTLVILGVGWMRHERSRYRIYDRRWRPLTPLLELPVTLTPVTGLQRGFLAEASLSRPDDSGYSFSRWVVIGRDGVPVAATHLGREERELRRGDDVVVLPSDGHLAAYRPSTRQVFRIGAAGRRLPGHPDSAGMYCDAPERALSSQATYWSTDGGHTWPSLRLAGVLRSRTGPADILGCRARPDRLTLVIGEGDDNRADRVITVALDGDRAVSSHRLDRRVFGPIFDALPDGRIIFPAHRPGFLVATDATNTGFELRPAPTVLGPDFSAVGHEIVVVPWAAHRHELLVSADAGRTWRTVDLKGEGWNRPS